MTRGSRMVIALAAAAGVACESIEPDLGPVLTLQVEATAVAAEPVAVQATLRDDAGLAELVVDWGEGTVDTFPLSGTSSTVDIEHTFGTLDTFEVWATLSDDAGQTDSKTVSIEVGPAAIAVEPAGGDTINAIGFTTSFTARAYDALGDEIPDFEPQWESPHPAIATAAAGGVVTAVGPGEAQIRARWGNAVASVDVLVRQIVAAVAVTAPDTLGVREALSLAVVVSDSNDVAIPDAEVAWLSTAPTVVTVDGTGLAAGVVEGAGEIVATAESVADTAAIEVSLALLFAAEPDGSDQMDIFTMTRHGTERRRLTDYELLDYEPAWSPDRSRIAFWSARAESGTIMVMDADGSNVREVPTGLITAHSVAWSPDGARLAFAGRAAGDADDIYTIDLDGTGLTRLTTDAGQEEDPAWSPDGSRIAFVGFAFVESDIMVMNADGSGLVNLTDEEPAQDKAPTWSPDGTEIAFASTRPDQGAIQIHRMNADGTDIRVIGEHSVLELDWSPDGTMFVYATMVDEQQDIFILPADGGEVTRVTNDARWEQGVRWR